MAKNDPDALEAEVGEMLEQLQKGKPEPSAGDTQAEPEELNQEAPTEPVDTAEYATEEVPDNEDEGGEPSELDKALKETEKATKAMKGAQAKMTSATQEAAQLRKQNAELVESLTELKSQLVESKRDNEKLQQLREDYPDFAPILDELSATQAEIQNTRDALSQQEQKSIEEERAAQMQAHFARIEAVHPDVGEITQTSDWALWLDQQDDDIKNWVDNGSSNDVNSVLTKFKTDLGLDQPQETALERAKQVADPKMPKARKANKGGDKRTWTVDEIKDMPLDEFEKYQSEILSAQAQGAIRR
tara:strand:+ start:1648 stop:2553 length:906 start_codon:yes stop_codon:yes gene_type:complete